jgi:hypothetical protein
LSGLFDFFQSASNTVADNVAGPVDLINAGLGLFGLRSKEPVGGSEWMKRWGLKRDVEMGGARLAGETAGLLSPTLLAAKAPQIAKGLLQAQENAAIPRQFNPEMGAIVYHGSPHKFDKFDSSKIGTGEGAQAYGHGLYLADEQAVAKDYANKLSNYTANGKALSEDLNITLGAVGGNLEEAIKIRQSQLDNWLASGVKDTKGIISGLRKDIRQLEGLRGKKIESSGALYKVDLPDEAIAKMLDWDKPLSQQPHVQAALRKDPNLGKLADFSFPSERGLQSMTGEQLVDQLGRLSPRHADQLRELGIPGIRYLDSGSRGAGTGTSNYVVFPGEEHLLKILERNGGLMGP